MLAEAEQAWLIQNSTRTSNGICVSEYQAFSAASFYPPNSRRALFPKVTGAGRDPTPGKAAGPAAPAVAPAPSEAEAGPLPPRTLSFGEGVSAASRERHVVGGAKGHRGASSPNASIAKGFRGPWRKRNQ